MNLKIILNDMDLHQGVFTTEEDLNIPLCKPCQTHEEAEKESLITLSYLVEKKIIVLPLKCE